MRTVYFYLIAFVGIAGILGGIPAFAGMGGGGGPGGGASGGMGGDSGMETSPMPRGTGQGMRGPVDIDSMPSISTGGMNSGNATIEMKPYRFSDGRLELKYYANTHTVSLGKYDLMELTTLEVDGNIYRPLSIARMRGHHAGGRIVFEVPEMPRQFRVIIRGVPSVEERIYEW
ncbi:MAG: hypothetical protein JSV26_03735 [bacterium]|nr:MAG: hypothetical protein JSV26_03735 [bacterium]